MRGVNIGGGLLSMTDEKFFEGIPLHTAFAKALRNFVKKISKVGGQFIKSLFNAKGK